MDDPKETMSDDEFHFSEAEEATSDPYALSEDESGGRIKSKINRRNVLIAIGIVIVALALYKLIGIFFGGDDTKKTATVTTSEPLQPSPVTTGPSIEGMGVKPQPTVQIQSQLSAKELQAHFSKIQENDDENKQQIFDQLNNLSNSLQSLNQAIASMNQQLQQVASELAAQQSAISALRVRSVPKRTYVRSAIRPPVVQRSKWYIQAMIPGRAWLIQTNGNTTSVQVGDVLKGQGRVQSISVIDGTVKLSSGAILRYENI